MRIAEDKAADFQKMAETDAAEFSRREVEYRSLLECTVFALEWHFERFDNPKFFECDCFDNGGYMEYDTNAYIHTERCSSGFIDSMPALRDQIRQVLGRPSPGGTPDGHA